MGYDDSTLKDTASNTSGSKDGVAFGALAGVDLDLGGGIFGIEGEVGDSSTSQTETDIFAIGDSGKLSSDLDLYVGARSGVRAGSNTLLYVKGGYTRTRVTLAYTSGGPTVSDSDNFNGFRLGAGVQYNMKNVGLRLEYRYSDYGEYTYQDTSTGLSVSGNQGVVGLIGRF